MIKTNSQDIDQAQNPNIEENDDFENDDLITFLHDSKKINLNYSQLTKYSKHVRETYMFSDVSERFPREITQFQKEYQLTSANIDYFFQLLRQNYEIGKDSEITYAQCIDFLKISKYLGVRKLTYQVDQYIKSHSDNVDFIIQMVQYDISTHKGTEMQTFDISVEVEQLLTSKINECLSNEKFKELPIQIIYRVVSKSSPKSINSNKLFDIIIGSISKFHVLFQFLDLQKLSEDRLEDLCEIYSKSDEITHQYFGFLKCNLYLIREMSKKKKNLEETNEEQKKKMDELETKIASLQKQFDFSEKANNQLQNEMKNEHQRKLLELETKVTSLQKQMSDSEKANNQLQNELKNEHQNKLLELETKVTSLQKQYDDSEKTNNQLQNELNDSKDLNNKQQNKMKDLENQVSLLQKQLDEIFLIKGKIVAKVEEGICVSAEIDLKENNSPLDTSKSKFIISTSGEKSLGCEEYEKGEPITSLHMKTSAFICRPSTYFVRCIVFNSNGEWNEIVSNAVTTSSSSLDFDYKEEKPYKVQLLQGKYKLEVWGAKGGDSTGKGYKASDYNRFNQSLVEGGFGGYSRGILNLKENTTVYVYVGGQGLTGDSSEGSSKKGGFPDGGGTKTGHYSGGSTVPGTGGGSTSIRIGSDTNYARVIVAGGGGGASGDSAYTGPGGFGGGLNGGNCYFNSKLQSQGAGTQTGSTRGIGCTDDRHGDPGLFGSGATGKYIKGCDSGGGGGGGWYGGGSGGNGNCTWCSSGGGGSGWTFTESHFNAWQSGDSSNASKFVLSSVYYLTDDVCVGGNEEFPRPDGKGTERGHAGNGYAKITPL